MTEARSTGRSRYGGKRTWLHGRKESSGLATLIVGAGSAARTLMRDLRTCPDYGLRPVGFLDDDPGIRSVFGTPVLGTLADLGRVVREHQIQAIIIAIPSLPPAAHSRLIRAATDTGAHVRYLP
jgi:FlaA1/EpsC-like NDP-sugar epimerase